MNVIYHLQYFYALWSLLQFMLWRASLSLQPKCCFLTRLLETQITGQHRPLKVNYVYLTKTDKGPVSWWLRKKDTHPCHVRSHEQFKTKYLLLWKAYATKLGRVVTCDKGNSAMMIHYPLNTWSRVTTKLDRAVAYLLFLKVYDHQNLQGSYLWQGKLSIMI